MMPSVLDGLALFEGLTAAQRATMAHTLRDQMVDPGAVLFAQGADASSCFIVLDGQICVDMQVEGRGAERLGVLERGALFGEVALLDGGLRSAGCSAGPRGAYIAELTRADFDLLFQEGDAMAHALMDTILDRLAGRLRSATARLVEVSTGA
jgi:CRP/FNR family transcriptional regulator, cyclic AMP receptor protein